MSSDETFNVVARATSTTRFISCVDQCALMNWKMLWHLIFLGTICYVLLFLRIETNIISSLSAFRHWITLHDWDHFSLVIKNTCLITRKCLIVLKIHNYLRWASSRSNLLKEQSDHLWLLLVIKSVWIAFVSCSFWVIMLWFLFNYFHNHSLFAL